METEEKKWCVYIHRNKINNKAYIGIAKGNPKKRWGDNGCKYTEKQKVFYNAIKKYGWDNFEHIIWSNKLTKQDAKEWEIRLIALFKTNCCKYINPSYGYNMTDGGDGINGCVRTEETKEKIKGANNPSAKCVVQIDINGNIVREWEYAKLASDFLNINLSAIIACCRRKRKIAGGFFWRYKNEYSPSESFEYKSQKKKTVQLKLDNTFINEYDSASDAAKNNGINVGSVINCCLGISKTSHGFKWMYKDEYLKTIQN